MGIAHAVEQSERSTEKTNVSHATSTNDPLLLERAYIEGWVLALTFGAEEELRAGHIGTGLLVTAMSIGGQFIVIRWPKIKARIAERSPGFTEKFSRLVSNPAWWVVTFMVFLAYLALSPFAQQQKWPSFPISWNTPSASEIAESVVERLPKQPTPITPTAEEIASAVITALPKQPPSLTPDEIVAAAIKALPKQPPSAISNSAALEQMRTERDKAQSDLAAARTAVPKTRFLGLDDVKRWKLLKTFRDSMPGRNVCNGVLEYPMDQAPEFKKTTEVWDEIAPVLNYSGWVFSQNNARAFNPPGITIFIGDKARQYHDACRRPFCHPADPAPRPLAR
jgi:hypothetical protein